ncbi:hypothetical protein [Zobellia galactanivorans]|uniref:hypothetical protein n=1 Tax=Zobellia galactanivorans (strain DSM 12802 / CCUG 47099 / CIP 106680 / NCIMB 13871 / Dsij) TaxID=63186 RepID=UPI001C067E97|nr:hypothetical protein [Zobellia galactanivorans]MBU3025669.1 hypothetical protein [Zobellia galactanivorans]
MDPNPSASLKTLSIIHLALVGGIAVFGVITYLNNGSFIANADPNDMYIYVVPVVGALGYFLSQFLFKKQLQTIDKNDSLSLKLGKYQSASITKYALLEGPAILSIFAYNPSGNALFLVVAIFLVVYLFMQKPSERKFTEEVPLSLEDKKQFNNQKK